MNSDDSATAEGWCYDCSKPLTAECVEGEHSHQTAVTEEEYEAMKPKSTETVAFNNAPACCWRMHGPRLSCACLCHRPKETPTPETHEAATAREAELKPCIGCGLAIDLHGIPDGACWGCELAKLRADSDREPAEIRRQALEEAAREGDRFIEKVRGRGDERNDGAFVAMTRLVRSIRQIAANVTGDGVYFDCAMCGAPRSFVIDPNNDSVGYCFVEEQRWEISAGPLAAPAPPISKGGE